MPTQPIGACALLFNRQRQILLGRRQNGYKAGLYGLPGGGVGLNEPVVEAVCREVFEETGLKLDKPEFVGVVRENQGEYDFIHFVFVVHDLEQEPILGEPEKCDGWEWFDLDRLPESLLPGHQTAIEMYQQNQKLVDLAQ